MAVIVHELESVPDVAAALLAFQAEPQLLLLDSARHDQRGRYSFLMADPVRSYVIDQPQLGMDPFAAIRVDLAQWSSPTLAGLPPFQGGAAGMLTYELGHCWEHLPVVPHNEFQIPAAVIGIYDWVIAWDHSQDRAWVIVQELGRPASTVQLRQQHVLEHLANREQLQPREPLNAATQATTAFQRTPAMPGFPATNVPGVSSNFSRDRYLVAAQQVIDYIFAGDIFQANLSQRLLWPTVEHPLEIYRRLRAANPAPFGGFLQYDDWAVLSSSPERFLELRGKSVKTRPIKGTRQRHREPQLDLFRQDELRESHKDHAENVMIVDLLRNDLSRVCAPGSIQVPELCTVETFETVSHLVSEVVGELEPGQDFWELLAATFPGGSITGAPKVRAMQIISELEQVARGPYCGSLFYLGCDGSADSSILIRTMTYRSGWLQFPVGGGIVAESQPAAEYEETLHKAQGMLRALTGNPAP